MTTKDAVTLESLDERLTTLEGYIENHVATKEQATGLDSKVDRLAQDVHEFREETNQRLGDLKTDLDEIKGAIQQLLP